MNDAFNEILRSWQNFYFMTGGAAAALLGLMFVALSLGLHLINDETRQNFGVFVTPSVFYFVSALVLSSTMLVPAYYQPTVLAGLLFLGGLYGLVHCVGFARRLIQVARKYQDFDLAEWLSQVILPLANYGLFIFAAVCFVIDQWSLAFAALWLANIMLLISAIANTWSLVLWIIEQREE